MHSEITIAGNTFNVPIRYGEGYTLNEKEAAVLNQAYHNGLRNSFTQKVKKGLAAGRAVEDLQSELDDYAERYQFGARNKVGRVYDPVIEEALSIARSRIREELLGKGKKLKDVDGRSVIKAARKLIAASPEIVKLAQRRVKETRKVDVADLKALVADI